MGPTIPREELRYCLYARKSTESDERQAMSIDSQIKEMLQVAQREGIRVTEIKRESHSAKETLQRPEFRSESDERQAMSIDSQIKEMLQVAQREGIRVTEIKRESHSAKETLQRPEFNK